MNFFIKGVKKKESGKDKKRFTMSLTKYVGIFIILIFVLERGISFFYNAYFYRRGHEEYSKDFVTNTDALYSKEYFTKVMKRYHMGDASQIEKLYKNSYVIPGLKTTRTLIQGEHLATCTSMTPQGVCVAGEYVLISAYCSSGKHNSVIYVINKSTHHLVKELVLHGRPHVGGIAYDPRHQNVWFCDYDSKSGTGYVSAFSMSELRNYDLKKKKKAIHYLYSNPIYSLKRTSFLDYQGGKLYIGHYQENLSSLTSIQSFTIDKDSGNIVSYNGLLHWNMETKDDMVMPSEVSTIGSRVQGFTINSKKSALSISRGILSSRLLIFDKTKEADAWQYAEDPDMAYSLPPMLEQISDSNGKLYLCFESASYAYRKRLNKKVDRILVIDF